MTSCVFSMARVSFVERSTICGTFHNGVGEHAKEQKWFVTKCVNRIFSDLSAILRQKPIFIEFGRVV